MELALKRKKVAQPIVVYKIGQTSLTNIKSYTYTDYTSLVISASGISYSGADYGSLNMVVSAKGWKKLVVVAYSSKNDDSDAIRVATVDKPWQAPINEVRVNSMKNATYTVPIIEGNYDTVLLQFSVNASDLFIDSIILEP
jgi:hypothetical protein